MIYGVRKWLLWDAITTALLVGLAAAFAWALGWPVLSAAVVSALGVAAEIIRRSIWTTPH